MSADLLRRAAAKLRSAAMAGYITPAPWDCLDGGDRLVHIETASGSMEYVVDEPMSSVSNAEYIALVHPPVALAGAELLDAHAKSVDARVTAETICGLADGEIKAPTEDLALAVARAVLREPEGGEVTG